MARLNYYSCTGLLRAGTLLKSVPVLHFSNVVLFSFEVKIATI